MISGKKISCEKHTIHTNNYAHGSFFITVLLWSTSISFRVTSLALEQSHDFPGENEATPNSLGPRDAYMRQWTRPSLVQIMACRLFGANPLSTQLLDFHLFDPVIKWNKFHSRTWRRKCRLENEDHFVRASIGVLRLEVVASHESTRGPFTNMDYLIPTCLSNHMPCKV